MGRFAAPRPFLARIRRRSALRHVAAPAVTAAALGLAAASPGARAQGPVRIGGEVRVNTTTAGDQRDATVATAANGSYAVVWVSSDGNGDGVYAQRYTADGVAQGAEFRVNTTTTGTQRGPAATMDADGDLVVAWESPGQPGNGATVVNAQRYNAAGVAQGGEFLVNAFTGNGARAASVAAAPGGDFVVAWQYDGGSGYSEVYARRYTAAGAAVGGEFIVNTSTFSTQAAPSVAVSGGTGGAFVVAWQSYTQDGNGDGVYARRYNGAGVAQGGEIAVNEYTTDQQRNASVGMDADGDFFVAWTSAGQDAPYTYGVYARRFSAAGVAQGGEFRVNTRTTDDQRNASVGVDADGDVVVAWTSYGQDAAYSYGVHARRYGPSGEADGEETLVNTYTTGDQRVPSVGVTADGDVVVAWESSGQDGSGRGVYHQRFAGVNRPVATTAPGVPGAEFRVNTYTTNAQSLPSVGVDADGDFVVAWASNGQDGAGFGVYAQRYSAAGVAQGAEFHVNTYTTGTQSYPSVGVDADGDFVVAWQSYGQDGSFYGIYAQRYSAAGVAQGVEFRVNTYTTNFQSFPAVGVDADGDFVVAWQSYGQDGSNHGVYAQRYSAAGVAQGAEFRVNQYTADNQTVPSVGVDADGDFVVAWASNGQDGSYYGTYARRYSADGVAQGGAFSVNQFTTGNQTVPSVGVDVGGDFVVAWASAGQDGSVNGVYARQYNAAGVAQGAEFRVNTTTSSGQTQPSVGVDADGDFAVAWQSFGQDGSNYGIYAQRYSAAGVAQGAEFRANTYTTGDQTAPSVGVDADGDFVVAWASNGQDGSVNGVYARRYPLTQAVLAAELRGAEGWRQLAAPTATATVGDLLGPVWTQGFPGADYAGGQPNVYRYDEPAAGGLASGYVPPASQATAMGSGRGYFAYVYEDNDFNTAGVQGGFPKALQVTGDAPAGPVALPVSYTDTADPELEDGWNLVGNPYRQSIDWDLAVRQDVATSAYVYDPALPGYRVWNGVAGNLPDGVVTALQGFWVKAMDTDASGTATPSASVPAAAQVSGGTLYGRGGEEAPAGPVLGLRLTREGGGYGREAEAFVSFEAGAQAGLDMADAYLLDPAAPDYTALYTHSADGTALAVQALPEGSAHAFPLGVAAVEGGAPAGGTFTLSWDAPALGAGATARLVDAVTGASVDLTAAGTYTFTLDAPASRTGAPAVVAALTPPAPRVLSGGGDGLTGGRFTVVVNGATTGTEAGAAALALTVAPNPLTGAGVVRYVLPEAGRVRVALYDVLGREVAVLADAEQGAGRYDVALDAGALAPGAYLVRLTAGETALVRRVTVAR